jgi:hypothetical protein
LEHRKHRTASQRAKAEIDLCDFVSRTIRKQRLSVPQLAERLAEILDEPVSPSRLYSFTASTKVSARLPAYFLRALCEVLDSDDILLFLARPRLQKQVELAETVRELRLLCDELLRLQESNAKRSAHHA